MLFGGQSLTQAGSQGLFKGQVLSQAACAQEEGFPTLRSVSYGAQALDEKCKDAVSEVPLSTADMRTSECPDRGASAGTGI